MDRRPEPSAITEAPSNVAQYDQVMQTKLAASYAVILELLFRARQRSCGGYALDLACGPGHFTLCLAQYLRLEHVLGVDLSEGMVATATANARRFGLEDKVRFCLGDATNGTLLGDTKYDLVTCTHAAHHFPDLQNVRQMLAAMDQVTHPDGLLALVDLVRLRSVAATERYVGVVGADYVKQGLSDFLEDFRNSMYAAWTVEELASAVPPSSMRHWVQLVPRGLPAVQCLLGLPRCQRRVLLRRGVPWSRENSPVPPRACAEYTLLRQSLLVWGRQRILRATNERGHR